MSDSKDQTPTILYDFYGPDLSLEMFDLRVWKIMISLAHLYLRLVFLFKTVFIIILRNHGSSVFATSMDKLRKKEIHKHIYPSVSGKIFQERLQEYIRKIDLVMESVINFAYIELATIALGYKNAS